MLCYLPPFSRYLLRPIYCIWHSINQSVSQLNLFPPIYSSICLVNFQTRLYGHINMCSQSSRLHPPLNLQSRLSDFSEYRTKEDMQLTELGTIKASCLASLQSQLLVTLPVQLLLPCCPHLYYLLHPAQSFL